MKKANQKLQALKNKLANAANKVLGLIDNRFLVGDNTYQLHELHEEISRWIGEIEYLLYGEKTRTDIDYNELDAKISADEKIDVSITFEIERFNEGDKNEIKKFEVGKTYVRIVEFDGGYKSEKFYKVSGRTATTIVLNDGTRNKIRFNEYSNSEFVMLGRYIGAPSIWAKDVYAMEETATEESYVEDDGSNDDADEENFAMTLDCSVDEDDGNNEDDELVDEPIKFNYAVLSYDGKKYKLNGKNIKASDAEREVLLASGYDCKFRKGFNPYETNSTMLLVDHNAFHRLRIKFISSRYLYFADLPRWRTIYFRVVDLGRDSIPFINKKVASIVEECRAIVKKDEEENARWTAYRKSPEYKLSQIMSNIRHCDSYISYKRECIRNLAEGIIRCYEKISGMENSILEYGIDIFDVEKDQEELIRQAKIFKDEIAMRDAFANINAAAAEMIDDGSNEDDEEENVLGIDYSVYIDDEVDEDDELVDEAIVEDNVAQFEIGSIYYKSVNCLTKHIMKVIDRTNKTVTIYFAGKEYKCKIQVSNSGVEYVNASGYQGRRKVEFYADEYHIDCKRSEEMAAATEPVNFELERFNDSENTVTDDVAIIDTAIAGISIVDEDAEIDSLLKNLSEKYKSVRKEADDLQKEIYRLQELQRDKYCLIHEIQSGLYKSVDSLINWMHDTVHFGDKKVVIQTPSKNFAISSISDLTVNWDEKKQRLILFAWREGIDVASYTVKEYKAAILELAAAIERGDKEFVFPADDSKKAQKKIRPNLTRYEVYK